MEDRAATTREQIYGDERFRPSRCGYRDYDNEPAEYWCQHPSNTKGRCEYQSCPILTSDDKVHYALRMAQLQITAPPADGYRHLGLENGFAGAREVEWCGHEWQQSEKEFARWHNTRWLSSDAIEALEDYVGHLVT